MVCLVCQLKKVWGVCQDCEEQLRIHFLQTQTSQYLCSYEGVICELIRRAKIENQRPIARLLIRLFLEHANVTDCDAIMSAPSSFWGRMRGRFDLGYHLAYALAKKHRLIFVKPPYALGWHKTKRSRSRLFGDQILESPIQYPGMNILLVDDVRTTGHTLGTLERSIECKRIRSLTLAGVSMK
jgi:predicted amidophosphoribosyltransferase